MSNATAAQSNITGTVMVIEIAVLCIISTVPCCVFLIINVVMLFTLRSKAVFCETPRYILLFNLLFADTVLLVESQSLYVLSASRTRLQYPLCCFLVMLANLNTMISPLTLLLMSLERYVAVCYPLRHAMIVTIRNTGVAVVMIWAFSFLNVFVRVVLLLKLSLSKGLVLKTYDYCGKEKIFEDPLFNLLEEISTYFLYILTAVTIISSYFCVMAAAWTASADKVSAQKACKTLLLHVVQLGLSLCSPLPNALLHIYLKHLSRITAVRIQVVMYICFTMFPRCLSSLIYGLRDQTIRPFLLQNLLTVCLSCLNQS